MNGCLHFLESTSFIKGLKDENFEDYHPQSHQGQIFELSRKSFYQAGRTIRFISNEISAVGTVAFQLLSLLGVALTTPVLTRMRKVYAIIQRKSLDTHEDVKKVDLSKNQISLPKNTPENTDPAPILNSIKKMNQNDLINKVNHKLDPFLRKRRKKLKKKIKGEEKFYSFEKYIAEKKLDFSKLDSKERILNFIKYFECVLEKNAESDNKLLTLIKNNPDISHLNCKDIENELNNSLKNVWIYLDKQEMVIESLYYALRILLDQSQSNTNVEFANRIYQNVISFLLKEIEEDTESPFLENLVEIGLDPSSFPSDDTAIQQNLKDIREAKLHLKSCLNNHSITKYLLRLIKKQIEVEKCQDIVKELLKKQNLSNERITKVMDCLKLTWLHGTKAYVIHSACTNSNREILCAGELRKRKIDIITGEMERGAYALGRNNLYISGCALSGAQMCIDYAVNFPFNLKSEISAITSLLRMKIEYYEDALDDGKFSRLIESIKRVKRLAPKEFIKQIPQLKMKIEEIYQNVNEFIFNSQTKQIFRWHDYYYTSKFFIFLKAMQNLEDIIVTPISNEQPHIDETILNLVDIPTVIASNTKFGIFLDNKQVGGEKCFPGGIQLDQDINMIFVEDKHISQIQNLLKSHQLEKSIQVESLSILKLASKVEESFSDTFHQILPKSK